jgi:DNA ligase-1
MSTLLATLVAASEAAAGTSSRIAKRDAIAARLRGAEPDEIEVVVAWLSGLTTQGRIGLGYATLASQRGEPAGEPSLTLREVDDALTQLGATTGKGSAAARGEQLRALFARATAAEQDFLVRLLVGELRQGALEGVMLDAIAAASGVPAVEVRRAAMVTGSPGTVARIALTEGEAGLARFAIALHRPVQPMLASPADDIAGAMAQLATPAL